LATTRSTPSSRLDHAVRKAAGGTRVRVRHEGNEAVVVPLEDAALLEAIEDYIDIKAVRRRHARAAKLGERPISWNKAKKSLGW